MASNQAPSNPWVKAKKQTNIQKEAMNEAALVAAKSINVMDTDVNLQVIQTGVLDGKAFTVRNVVGPEARSGTLTSKVPTGGLTTLCYLWNNVHLDLEGLCAALNVSWKTPGKQILLTGFGCSLEIFVQQVKSLYDVLLESKDYERDHAELKSDDVEGDHVAKELSDLLPPESAALAGIASYRAEVSKRPRKSSEEEINVGRRFPISIVPEMISLFPSSRTHGVTQRDRTGDRSLPTPTDDMITAAFKLIRSLRRDAGEVELLLEQIQVASRRR